ncbi:MAG: phage head closure protein [Chloroflexi bacterium]|nr:phage head closure protein [Chloroflexota bacterium]
MPQFTVNPGEMRTRITFQSPTVNKDAGGAQSETWANVTTNPTVWAKFVHDHGQEGLQDNAVVSTARATVTVRYRSDILPSWQILSNSLAWKIISPPENVQNENRWTVFRVERVTGTV